MIREKHELRWKAIPKRRGNNGKRSRHGHGCPSSRDKSSRLSMERRGRRDVAEVGSRMASRRYLGATPMHLGLENNKQNFIFNASRDWKPMEMFLDVVGDMGVTGSTWQECHALFPLLFQLSKHH